MKKKSNINLVSTYSLVFVSLGLLLLFLSFWNVENYRSEKEKLEKELINQAKLASGAINDSILWTVINVVGMDTTINTHSNLEGLPKIGESLTGILKKIQSTDKSGITASAKIEQHQHEGTADTMIYIDLSHNVDFRIETKQEVKMMHKESEEPLTSDEIQAQVIESFRNGLIENNLPNEFELVDCSISDSTSVKSDEKAIVIGFDFDRFSKVSSKASFTDYGPYLFNKITPSLVISLSLFLLIAGAIYWLLKMWKQQIQLNQLKSEFVSNMTHELKTPISTVGVALEALSDFGALKDPNRTKEYIDISKHELNRLTILVDKVLKMSAFDSNSSSLKVEPINLKNIVEGILQSMKLHFEKKNVQLNYVVKGSNFDLEGDRIHLTNVIYNLIDNAIKYSPKNPQVDIKIENHDDVIVFNIEDKGVGISEDYISKIYDRFFRVPQNDIHNVKGYGLGLSYVKRIIDQHHGKIKVESALNEGTKFRIEIPRKYHVD